MNKIEYMSDDNSFDWSSLFNSVLNGDLPKPSETGTSNNYASLQLEIDEIKPKLTSIQDDVKKVNDEIVNLHDNDKIILQYINVVKNDLIDNKKKDDEYKNSLTKVSAEMLGYQPKIKNIEDNIGIIDKNQKTLSESLGKINNLFSVYDSKFEKIDEDSVNNKKLQSSWANTTNWILDETKQIKNTIGGYNLKFKAIDEDTGIIKQNNKIIGEEVKEYLFAKFEPRIKNIEEETNNIRQNHKILNENILRTNDEAKRTQAVIGGYELKFKNIEEETNNIRQNHKILNENILRTNDEAKRTQAVIGGYELKFKNIEEETNNIRQNHKILNENILRTNDDIKSHVSAINNKFMLFEPKIKNIEEDSLLFKRNHGTLSENVTNAIDEINRTQTIINSHITKFKNIDEDSTSIRQNHQIINNTINRTIAENKNIKDILDENNIKFNILSEDNELIKENHKFLSENIGKTKDELKTHVQYVSNSFAQLNTGFGNFTKNYQTYINSFNKSNEDIKYQISKLNSELNAQKNTISLLEKNPNFSSNIISEQIVDEVKNLKTTNTSILSALNSINKFILDQKTINEEDSTNLFTINKSLDKMSEEIKSLSAQTFIKKIKPTDQLK